MSPPTFSPHPNDEVGALSVVDVELTGVVKDEEEGGGEGGEEPPPILAFFSEEKMLTLDR